MKRIRLLAYKTALVITAVGMIALFFVHSRICVLFGASPETSREIAAYLLFFLASIVGVSFVRVTTAFFYAIENAGSSYILVYAEPVLLLLLLLTLPYSFGFFGVWLAVPFAQFIIGRVSAYAKYKVDRRMTATEQEGV